MLPIRALTVVTLMALATGCGSSSSSNEPSDASGGSDVGLHADGGASDAANPSDTSVEDAGGSEAGPTDGNVVLDGTTDSSGDSSSKGDGATFCPVACNAATSYCEASYGPPPTDGAAGTPSYACLTFNASCDAGAPSCACASVGPFCTCDESGGEVTVTCPFHP
jgi:hypothetical protein